MQEVTYDSSLFGWFQGHEGPGDTSLSRLSLPVFDRVSPATFNVMFKGGATKKFIHQYHSTAHADDYDSKYLAVYWCGDQTIYVHCC